MQNEVAAAMSCSRMGNCCIQIKQRQEKQQNGKITNWKLVFGRYWIVRLLSLNEPFVIKRNIFLKGFFKWTIHLSFPGIPERGRSPPKIIDMRKSVRNTNRQMDCKRCIGMQQIRSSHHQKEGSDNLDNMIKVEEIKGNHKFLLIRCSEFRYQCAF